MRPRIDLNHPLRQLFEALVEDAFMVEMGVCDPKLTDYLSELLTDFVHMDGIYRFTDSTGRPIRELSQMERDAVAPPGLKPAQRNRLLHRYMGDFSLFWAGLYPESLRRPRAQGDRLRIYLAQGKRCYNIASELSEPHDQPPGPLLRKLSEEFECCVHGLHLVRDGWSRMRPDSTPLLGPPDDGRD